jgi:hypothetical protein
MSALQKGAGRIARCGGYGSAFAGVPPPFFLREDKSKWRVVDSEADFANSRLAMDKTPTRIAL